MWKLKFLLDPRAFSPADDGVAGGQGGGAGAGAGAGGDHGQGGGQGQGGTGDGKGDDQGGGTGLMDFATGDNKGKAKADDGAGKGGDWKAPETIPEHLRGKTPEETLDKLQKAYAGARQELSKKGQEPPAPDVPKDISGYEIKVVDDKDDVGKELTSEASKPFVDKFRAAALKHGIGATKFAAFMRDGMSGLKDLGVPMGVSDDDASKISGELELESLTKIMGGTDQANTVISTVMGMINKQAAAKVLDASEVEELKIAFGTAKAAAAMYKVLTGYLGEKPIPPALGADGSITVEEAYAAHGAALRIKDPAERAEAVKKAEDAIKKAVGTGDATSVRSAYANM